MARITPDGFFKLHHVPTVVDKTAPTIGEITAGTELTGFLAPAGIETPTEGQEVDASDLSTAFDKSVPGTFGGSVNAEFYRDDATDTAWTTLPRLTTGFLVFARFGGSGADNAIAIGDEVEVWPVRVSSRSAMRVTRNETQRFTVNFATTDEPDQAATVAA